MTGTRCLYRSDREISPPGNGAPRGHGKPVLEARLQLADYLDVHLTRPLHFSAAQNAQRVETALDTMTQRERVFLEIEMQDRDKVMHAFDYDPLRGG